MTTASSCQSMVGSMDRCYQVNGRDSARLRLVVDPYARLRRGPAEARRAREGGGSGFGIGGTRKVQGASHPLGSEKPCIEWQRKQIAQSMRTLVLAEVRENHFEIAAEFPQNLTAGATRRRRVVSVGDDRHV